MVVVVERNAVLHYVILCYALLRCVTLRYAALCYAMLRCASLRYAMLADRLCYTMVSYSTRR